MTENLRLTGSRTLTQDDSNVTSNYTLPASSTSWCIDLSVACMNTAYVLDYSDAEYGSYYSWRAATAGKGTASTDPGEKITSSVCPKGWRFPIGGSNSEFQTLYNRYSSATALLSVPVEFALAGFRYGSSYNDKGSRGRYWSSTAGDWPDAYNLSITSSSVDVSDEGGKYGGMSVRCVAQQPCL